jgi:aminotransferase
MRKEYKKRVDFMVRRLNEIEGVHCPYPEGTFYVFPNISELGIPSREFVRDFSQAEKVRCAPGTQYGDQGEGFIRFALVRPVEVLEEACVRLENFIARAPK